MTEREERLAVAAPEEHSHTPRPRDLAVAVGVGVLVAAAFVVVVGVITDGIDTPLRARLTPLLAVDYPIWGLNAALLGALAGLSVYAQRSRRRVRTGALFGGGFLAAFAVSCPLCNWLLVAAFGAGGVLSFIEPARPFLGGAATLFLAYILVRRLRAFRSECPACGVHAAPTAVG